MSDMVAANQTILVVGGGTSGMTAALQAAEVGNQVIVVEKSPSVAYGRNGKDAGLDGQIVPAKKREEIAGK